MISKFKIFLLILLVDLKILFKKIPAEVFNVSIWFLATVLVLVYIGPGLNLDQHFIAICVFGSIASTITNIIPVYVRQLSDLCGDRVISYYTILPLPYWVVFLSMICYSAIYLTVTSIISILIGSLLVPNVINLANINWIKLLFYLPVTSLTFGALSLILVAITPNMDSIENVITRIVFPLWFFGCFQFTWGVLNKVSPVLSYINLLNPYTYASECVRVIFNQGSELPFWLSIMAMLFIGIVLGFVSIKILKRRLDCV